MNETVRQRILKPATFPGGGDSLSSFVKKNLNWPGPDWDGEGVVRVELTISRRGKISKTRFLNRIDDLSEKEVLRLLKKMPSWTPAIDKNGNPISSEVTIPIVFKLEVY